MQKLEIRLDPKGKGYHVTCPIYLNHLIQAAPARRFTKTSRVWKCPATMVNAKYFLELMDGMHTARMVDCGPEVLQHLKDKAAGKVPVSLPFPPDYKFKTEPYGLQVEALNAAWGKDCFAFFMEMGTGKSKVYSDLASALYNQGSIDAVVVLTKYTLRRALRWTHEPPKVAGWYWMRRKLHGKWRNRGIVHIYMDFAGTKTLQAKGWGRQVGGLENMGIDFEWAGPIAPPVEG